MESDRRKVYVEVNVTHRPDGTARPNFIKFENDEKYEIDRVIQKCRAASTKVGGTGIRYTVQICSKKALAIRMKQLGLLKKEYLDNPFDLVTVYPEVSEL